MNAILPTLIMSLFSSSTITDMLSKNGCSPELSVSGRVFMLQEQLIKDGEERPHELELWRCERVVERYGKQLVVMTVKSSEDSTDHLEIAEVLVYCPKSQKFSRFENTFHIPSMIKAKFGSCSHRNGNFDYQKCTASAIAEDHFYFAYLSGESAINAFKAKYAGLSYRGFSGIAIRGAKLPFDPTEGRTWNLEKAEFSLRFGQQSGEGYDIPARDLDGYILDQNRRGCFNSSYQQAVFSGCFSPYNDAKSCEVIPWDAGYLLDII